MAWQTNLTMDLTNIQPDVVLTTLRPTPGGNCDETGIGYGFCGGSDYHGLVYLYHPARAPRGARAVQRWWVDGVLFPDAW
jgi:hypothetical protein